jgi:hypothetical protein
VQFLLLGCALFEEKFILPLPVALDADQIKSVGFTAHWKKVTGASNYEIDIALDQEFTQFAEGFQDKQVNDHFLVAEGLEAGTTYYYRVRANISNQTSQSSNIIEVTTEALDVPITYHATQVIAVGFTVHWKKMPVVTSYELDVAQDENFTNFLEGYQAKEIDAQDTSWVVNNVTVNKQFFYRIRVQQSNSYSAYSNVQSVFTSTLPQPKVLTASQIKLTSFMAHWQAMNEAVSYQVDVAKDALFQQMLTGYDNLQVSANSLVVPNLDANAEYFYRVRAVNNDATSNHSEVMSVKTLNLNAPVATQATQVESGGFQANWEAVPNAASYLLDVALDQNFTQMITGYSGFPVVGTTTLLQGLDASTTYFYRVQAQGLNATSAYSNTIQVTTSPLPPPVATAVTSQTAFEFTVNWQAQTGISLYVLDIATDANFTNFLAGYENKEVVGTSHKVEEIDFRQGYYYRLRSKRLSKTSDNSNTINVAPAIGATCKLSDLKLLYSSGVVMSQSQRFVYDSQNRLIEIHSDNSAYTTYKYVIAYNPDNTIQQVTFIKTSNSYFYGNTVDTEVYLYDYQGGLLQSVQRNDEDGNLIRLWVFGYNAQGQRNSWSVYTDLAQTNLFSEYNYVYDAQGNVSEIKDKLGAVIRKYEYDQGLSPYALFHPDLCFFIANNRDRWVFSQTASFRGFAPTHNIIYEQIYSSAEVFIYDHNSKKVATRKKGFYNAEYTFTGCNF